MTCKEESFAEADRILCSTLIAVFLPIVWPYAATAVCSAQVSDTGAINGDEGLFANALGRSSAFFALDGMWNKETGDLQTADGCHRSIASSFKKILTIEVQLLSQRGCSTHDRG